MKLRDIGVLLMISIFIITNNEAWARKWNPSNLEVAQDYLLLEHGISENEKLIIVWFAPEYFPNTPQTTQLKTLLQSYMLIGFVHFRVDKFGNFEIINSDKPTIKLPDSLSINPLSENEIPPVVANLPDLLKRIMAGGLGKIGSGIQISVFDGKKVDSCSKGIFKIKYLAELYDFQLPLPGCE